MTGYLIPLITDLGAVLLYFLYLPILVSYFQQKSALNAIIVFTVYVLFCGSVFLIRKVDADAVENDYRHLLGFLGVFLGFLVIFMMEDLSGLLGDPDRLLNWGEIGDGVVVLFAGVVGLGLVFLYPGILWADIKSFGGAGRSLDTALRLMALMGINAMTLVTVAHWQVFFADAEPYEGLTFRGQIVIFLAVYVFFLLFYAPPRLFLVFRGASWFSFATFLLQTGLYVWRCLYSVKE